MNIADAYSSPPEIEEEQKPRRRVNWLAIGAWMWGAGVPILFLLAGLYKLYLDVGIFSIAVYAVTFILGLAILISVGFCFTWALDEKLIKEEEE